MFSVYNKIKKNKYKWISGYCPCFVAQWEEHLTVREVDGLQEEAFSMSGSFGAQCSVAPTRMILLALLRILDD